MGFRGRGLRLGGFDVLASVFGFLGSVNSSSGSGDLLGSVLASLVPLNEL